MPAHPDKPDAYPLWLKEGKLGGDTADPQRQLPPRWGRELVDAEAIAGNPSDASAARVRQGERR